MTRILDDMTLKRMFPGLDDDALDAVRGEITSPREVISESVRDIQGWTWESIALRSCDRFLELRNNNSNMNVFNDEQLLTMVASETWEQGRELGYELDLEAWDSYLRELLFPVAAN